MLIHLVKKLYCNMMPRLGRKFTISVKGNASMPMVLTIANTDCFVPAMYPVTTKAYLCPIILDVQNGESLYVLLSERKP